MSVRDLLRELPVFARPLRMFDPDSTPANPNGLFISWLEEAVAAGVVEPHARTLSTVDASGMRDLRVLLLKEVDDTGWQFATDMDSAKGRQIAGQPVAALGFYWREQGGRSGSGEVSHRWTVKRPLVPQQRTLAW